MRMPTVGSFISSYPPSGKLWRTILSPEGNICNRSNTAETSKHIRRSQETAFAQKAGNLFLLRRGVQVSASVHASIQSS